jgi:hypothetical protein
MEKSIPSTGLTQVQTQVASNLYTEYEPVLTTFVEFLIDLKKTALLEQQKKVGDSYPADYWFTIHYEEGKYSSSLWGGKNALDLSLEMLTSLLRETSEGAPSFPSLMQGRFNPPGNYVNLFTTYLPCYLGFFNFAPDYADRGGLSETLATFSQNTFTKLYKPTSLSEADWQKLRQAATERSSTRLSAAYYQQKGQQNNQLRYQVTPYYHYHHLYEANEISKIAAQVVEGEEKRLRNFLDALYKTLHLLYHTPILALEQASLPLPLQALRKLIREEEQEIAQPEAKSIASRTKEDLALRYAIEEVPVTDSQVQIADNNDNQNDEVSTMAEAFRLTKERALSVLQTKHVSSETNAPIHAIFIGTISTKRSYIVETRLNLNDETIKNDFVYFQSEEEARENGFIPTTLPRSALQTEFGEIVVSSFIKHHINRLEAAARKEVAMKDGRVSFPSWRVPVNATYIESLVYYYEPGEVAFALKQLTNLLANASRGEKRVLPKDMLLNLSSVLGYTHLYRYLLQVKEEHKDSRFLQLLCDLSVSSSQIEAAASDISATAWFVNHLPPQNMANCSCFFTSKSSEYLNQNEPIRRSIAEAIVPHELNNLLAFRKSLYMALSTVAPSADEDMEVSQPPVQVHVKQITHEKGAHTYHLELTDPQFLTKAYPFTMTIPPDDEVILKEEAEGNG